MQATQHFHAVDLRHLQVEDERVGRRRLDGGEALLAVFGDGDLVALILEVIREGTTNQLLVVADEDEEGNAFWQVRNEGTTNSGYVSADFLELATAEE